MSFKEGGGAGGFIITMSTLYKYIYIYVISGMHDIDQQIGGYEKHVPAYYSTVC